VCTPAPTIQTLTQKLQTQHDLTGFLSSSTTSLSSQELWKLALGLLPNHEWTSHTFLTTCLLFFFFKKSLINKHNLFIYSQHKILLLCLHNLGTWTVF